MTAEDSFESLLARAGLQSALISHVGYAFWQLSECEDAVAHFVTLRLKASRGMGRENGEALLAQTQRRTFGSLLKELQEKHILEQSLEAPLLALLEERNWLVHRSKRESRGVLFRSADFDRLVKRIDAIAEEASSLQLLVGRALEDFVVSCGVDPAFIDQEAARLARSWGYR
jgi:uncharacterized protein YutE (UPF0331/DUF86 family)